MSMPHKSSTWLERIAIAGCLVFVLGLLRLTLWKENEFFWLHRGGYPLWLRESVLLFYSPYFVFTATALCIITRSVLAQLFLERAYRLIWCLLFVAWILFFSNCGLLVANNFINIWRDQPLHYHPSIESGTTP